MIQGWHSVPSAQPSLMTPASCDQQTWPSATWPEARPSTRVTTRKIATNIPQRGREELVIPRIKINLTSVKMYCLYCNILFVKTRFVKSLHKMSKASKNYTQTHVREKSTTGELWLVTLLVIFSRFIPKNSHNFGFLQIHINAVTVLRIMAKISKI